MPGEGRDLAKRFPTLVTLIWPLPSVNSAVLNKVGCSTEGLPTFPTRVWPFSRVNPLVLDQIRSPAKTFPTLITVVRLCFSMDFLMFS